MDAQVDNLLGDSISYTANGTLLSRAEGDDTVPGFLGLFSDDGSIVDSITPQIQRWQLKIAVSWLPDSGPSARDTIEHAKLPAPMRPGPSNKTEDGRYWIIDLQRKRS